MKPMKRMHCPHCQSRQLSSVVETEFSPKAMRNKNRNYWVCESCGRKFANIQNLEEDLSTMEKNAESAIHGIILTVFLCLLSALMISLDASLLFYAPILILTAGIFLISKVKINKMESECRYLKTHCFC